MMEAAVSSAITGKTMDTADAGFGAKPSPLRIHGARGVQMEKLP